VLPRDQMRQWAGEGAAGSANSSGGAWHR
jgi:hypothetical protein